MMINIDWKKTRSYAVVVAVAVGATIALVPAKPISAQAAAGPAVGGPRGLPDFTELVEQLGPSVVNIRTVEKVKVGARGSEDEMQELFRRFFRRPPPQHAQAFSAQPPAAGRRAAAPWRGLWF